MRRIVFDIETSNTFYDIEGNNPADLDLSLVGVYDSETDSYSSYLVDELVTLWPLLERSDVLIGYNSDHFDIPLLNKYYPGDLGALRSIDILKEIKSASGRRPKLDHVAEATLGEKKSGNGLEAIRWWRNGDVEKVRDYCLQDVKITKEIYDYALKHGKVSYQVGKDIQDVLLDTSTWEDGDERVSMTHTLPF